MDYLGKIWLYTRYEIGTNLLINLFVFMVIIPREI